MNEQEKDLGAVSATAVDAVSCSAPVDSASHVAPMKTVAACAYCGRGYVQISKEGVGCLSRCGGRVYSLPVAEDGLYDDGYIRSRRKKLLRDWALYRTR